MLDSFDLWIHLTPMLFFCLLFVVLTSVFVRVGCGNLLLLCVGVICDFIYSSMYFGKLGSLVFGAEV